VNYIDHALAEDPKRPNVFVRKFNDVAVGLACKGVPMDTPVGISLHLRISRVDVDWLRKQVVRTVRGVILRHRDQFIAGI
jgi:hypothetical protein